MTNSALVSFSSIWVEPLTPTRLKLATLLFDEVIFMHDARKDWEALFAELFAGENSLSQSTLTKLRSVWVCENSVDRGFTIWGEHVTGKKGKALNPEAVDIALNRAAHEVIVPTPDQDHYGNYKLKVYSLSEILWWRRYHPNSVLHGASYIEDIVVKAAGGSLTEVASASSETVIPDLTKLPLQDILDLRQSDYLKHFRKKFEELKNTGQTKVMMDHYLNAMGQLVDQLKPNIPEAVALSVLGNLPIPGYDAVAGIASGILEVNEVVDRKKEFGWMYFLREVKHLADGSGPGDSTQ